MHPDAPHDPCHPAAGEELSEPLEADSLGGGTVLDILRRQSSAVAQHSLRVSELLSKTCSDTNGDPDDQVAVLALRLQATDPQAYDEAVDAFEKHRVAFDGLLLAPVLDLKTLATTADLLQGCAMEVVMRMPFPWPVMHELQITVVTHVAALRGGLSVFLSGIQHILAVEEARPGSVLPDYMFCRVGGVDGYRDFFPWKHGPELCGGKGYVARVALTPDNNGRWWCWRDARDGKVHHVWQSLGLLSMCFPYGIEAAVERGQGVYFRARVEIVERFED